MRRNLHIIHEVGTVKIKAECTVSFGELSLTSDEADIEVVDEEEGNKFLDISLSDHKVESMKASIIISTDDLKTILKVAEGSGTPQKAES